MDTEDRLYRYLQEFLDTLPGGFSATNSGSDIRLLKCLFTFAIRVPFKIQLISIRTLYPNEGGNVEKIVETESVDISSYVVSVELHKR